MSSGSLTEPARRASPPPPTSDRHRHFPLVASAVLVLRESLPQMQRIMVARVSLRELAAPQALADAEVVRGTAQERGEAKGPHAISDVCTLGG